MDWFGYRYLWALELEQYMNIYCTNVKSILKKAQIILLVVRITYTWGLFWVPTILGILLGLRGGAVLGLNEQGSIVQRGERKGGVAMNRRVRLSILLQRQLSLLSPLPLPSVHLYILLSLLSALSLPCRSAVCGLSLPVSAAALKAERSERSGSWAKLPAGKHT